MKTPIKLLAACAALLCLAFTVPPTESKQITVVIDAAHGGKDFGAKFNNYTEKEIVASIAAKIRQLNIDKEVIIHYTRNEDKFVSLEDRLNAINALKPDLVLSLHLNYEKGNNAYGMEFFANDKANGHAVKLENKFVRDAGYKSRGIKKAPFFLAKKADAPVIHFELGFLSHESDRAYLTSEEKQEQIAKTINAFFSELK